MLLLLSKVQDIHGQCAQHTHYTYNDGNIDSVVICFWCQMKERRQQGKTSKGENYKLISDLCFLICRH